MNKLSLGLGPLLVSALLAGHANAATATFQVLAAPFTGAASVSLSGDGSVLALNYFGEVFRYTATGGFQDLGPVDPNNGSIAVSQDGAAITSGIIGADNFPTPGLWTASTGWQDLGHPKNGCTPIGNGWGDGWGINAHGTVVVGLAWTCTNAEGFVWSRHSGSRSLGFPPGQSSRASGISANSQTIVGFWEGTVGRQPVRWLSFGAPDLFLGVNAGGEAFATTSNGLVIVGQAFPPNAPTANAFVYSDATGVKYLGLLKKGDASFANGVSDNGIVVGYSGNFRIGNQAFIWTKAGGLQALLTYLNNAGANIPSSISLTSALTISADGTTIAGAGIESPHKSINWIATLTK